MTNEEAWRSLTALQAQFVREYLISRNASDAMRKAGYKSKNPNVDASKLLARPSIRFLIGLEEKKAQEKYEIERDTILTGLAAMASTHLGNVASWDEQGNFYLKASKDLKPEELRFISSVKSTTRTITSGKDESRTTTTTSTLEVTTLAPQRFKALEALAKHLGILEKNDEGDGANGHDREALYERVSATLARYQNKAGER